MSRPAGSIVRGFQSRAGYPSKRAGSRCGCVLRTAQKVKVFAGTGSGASTAPGPKAAHALTWLNRTWPKGQLIPCQPVTRRHLSAVKREARPSRSPSPALQDRKIHARRRGGCCSAFGVHSNRIATLPAAAGGAVRGPVSDRASDRVRPVRDRGNRSLFVGRQAVDLHGGDGDGWTCYRVRLLVADEAAAAVAAYRGWRSASGPPP